jgi:D-alanyl-lipoteichoic acid acyltransferase DltB (MBOAT superfamily)
LTATRPPRLSGTLVALTVFTLLFLALPRLRRVGFSAVGGFTLLILGLFVVLKTEPLAVTASGWLRRVSGQSSDLAASMDLSWLGFSYVAFRLLHALRDHAAGRLPELSLREFIVYVLFFPTLTAGPIDRAARFLGDLRASKILTASETVQGGSRVLIGVFKKFVLADTLGLIALSAGNANQIMSRFWLWIVLYAYAFRLYLDFSGYTDVAIGMGQLAGVTLPENFNRPYTRRNLTVFWTSWHMTLAQWFRAYFFNPLTRALRRSRRKIPAPVVILIGQVTTMGLIGLWHGITWNFLLWGLWHGAGLFIHNRWVELQRAHPQWFTSKWYASRPAQALSVLATFHFVAVGWLWFALPDVGQSWALFLRLIGI